MNGGRSYEKTYNILYDNNLFGIYILCESGLAN